jgi:hypothetical protein
MLETFTTFWKSQRLTLSSHLRSLCQIAVFHYYITVHQSTAFLCFVLPVHEPISHFTTCIISHLFFYTPCCFQAHNQTELLS